MMFLGSGVSTIPCILLRIVGASSFSTWCPRYVMLDVENLRLLSFTKKSCS